METYNTDLTLDRVVQLCRAYETSKETEAQLNPTNERDFTLSLFCLTTRKATSGIKAAQVRVSPV